LERTVKKNAIPRPVVLASLCAGLLIAGCSSMGGSSSETVAAPVIDDKRVCEIQRQWNNMSPDEQTAALNYHLRAAYAKYDKADVDALRQRVRSTRC
jgi:hypothetical protein